MNSLPECEFVFNLTQKTPQEQKYCDRQLHWDNVYTASYELALEQSKNVEYSETERKKYLPTLRNIEKDIATKWQSLCTEDDENCLGKVIEFNTEWSVKNAAPTGIENDEKEDIIRGCPDIVTDTAVLDIVTTSSFTKMSNERFLQVWREFALLKANGRNLTYAGTLLPLQRDILIFNLEDCMISHYSTLCGN